ncbi:MAG TPA: hypothetical protein VFN92_10095 [Solirubrobacterales bacterium]|nr:hypothetical protein [Solirubrobacterales bacterium]
MSPEALVLDRFEEKDPAASRKRVEAASGDAVDLKEDTTALRDRRPLRALDRQPAPLAEGMEGEEARGTVQIVFDETPPARAARSPIKASLDALIALRSDAEAADWLEAAAVLKRDVVRLRDSSYSRHLAVLLALADALTFTEPDEVSPAGAKPLFSHALGLLSEPYISEASEEEFLGELLTAGWNLTPSAEQLVELVD